MCDILFLTYRSSHSTIHQSLLDCLLADSTNISRCGFQSHRCSDAVGWQDETTQAPSDAKIEHQRHHDHRRCLNWHEGAHHERDLWQGRKTSPQASTRLRPGRVQGSCRRQQPQQDRAVEGSEEEVCGYAHSTVQLSLTVYRFPKHTNDTIKATLSSCFARVGQHEADKVWKAVAS